MDTCRCVGRLHQQEAQQGIALLADVSQSLFASTGLLTRNHAHVRADLLAASVALCAFGECLALGAVHHEGAVARAYELADFSSQQNVLRPLEHSVLRRPRALSRRRRCITHDPNLNCIAGTSTTNRDGERQSGRWTLGGHEDSIRAPDTRILPLMAAPSRGLVIEAFWSGADGVFCRNSPFDLLCRSLDAISQGEICANAAELRYVWGTRRLGRYDRVLSMDGGD
jgi:hypothetical protein